MLVCTVHNNSLQFSLLYINYSYCYIHTSAKFYPDLFIHVGAGARRRLKSHSHIIGPLDLLSDYPYYNTHNVILAKSWFLKDLNYDHFNELCICTPLSRDLRFEEG